MSTPAPPGYGRPGLQQVLRADRALWLELAGRQPALTRSLANAPLADARCLDKAFEEASQTMDVNFHFMPLQQSQNPFEKGGQAARWRRWGDGKGFQPEKWRRTDKGKSGWKGGGKNKDTWKGKGENQKSSYFSQGENLKGSYSNKGLDNRGGKTATPMPAGLRGGVPRDDSGEPICYGFGLGQCKDAPVGGRCARGRHVCCWPGCFGNHAFIEHKTKSAKA